MSNKNKKDNDYFYSIVGGISILTTTFIALLSMDLATVTFAEIFKLTAMIMASQAVIVLALAVIGIILAVIVAVIGNSK